VLCFCMKKRRWKYYCWQENGNDAISRYLMQIFYWETMQCNTITIILFNCHSSHHPNPNPHLQELQPVTSPSSRPPPLPSVSSPPYLHSAIPAWAVIPSSILFVRNPSSPFSYNSPAKPTSQLRTVSAPFASRNI
jgi:hypothetical protein